MIFMSKFSLQYAFNVILTCKTVPVHALLMIKFPDVETWPQKNIRLEFSNQMELTLRRFKTLSLV